MAQLRIGTCSWKYPSWQNLIYSAPKGINFLEEYAKRYQTVEIDQWFWSLFEGHPPKHPNRKDVVEYGQSVSNDFRFSIKVPNSITLTHYYKKRKIDPLIPNPHFLSKDLWQEFIARIDPLRDRLGPLILQFEYLNKEKMKSQSDFHARVGRFFNEIFPIENLAVETRNPRYLNSGFFDFLKQRQLTPVLMHGYWMPSIVEVYHKWRDKIIFHETVVVRLHGPNRAGMEKHTGKRWDRIITPMDDELKKIAGIVNDLVDNGVNVYLNVNNHYEGSAPLTIERLSNLLTVPTMAQISRP